MVNNEPYKLTMNKLEFGCWAVPPPRLKYINWFQNMQCSWHFLEHEMIPIRLNYSSSILYLWWAGLVGLNWGFGDGHAGPCMGRCMGWCLVMWCLGVHKWCVMAQSSLTNPNIRIQHLFHPPHTIHIITSTNHPCTTPAPTHARPSLPVTKSPVWPHPT